MSLRLTELLFPPKCILCGKLLDKNETDLCRSCRLEAPEFSKPKFRLSFLAGWTAVWYYSGNVRQSLLRYKFRGRRNYAQAYGRMLAMKLQTEGLDGCDFLTWVPVSPLRKFRRGYDQCELLARATAFELGVPAQAVLRKIRHTPPQSRIRDAARRRANVLGAYRVADPEAVTGKTILLLDDIITTGATISECAKTLEIAGARQVLGAAVAAASHEKSSSKNVGE